MNFWKPFALSLIFAGAVFLPAARAGEANQKTKLVFSQPVGIPGAVLPAGTYWFILEPYTERVVTSSRSSMKIGRGFVPP
jgi:hypothetical protein